jgi:hypothetical protein
MMPSASGSQKTEREVINHAYVCTETEGNAAVYVCQIYDTQSGTLRAIPWGELDPSASAHDWQSSRAAAAAD